MVFYHFCFLSFLFIEIYVGKWSFNIFVHLPTSKLDVCINCLRRGLLQCTDYQIRTRPKDTTMAITA